MMLMICPYCEFACNLAKGPGVCKSYIIEDGAIVEREAFAWTRANLIKSEQIPIYHLYPNSHFYQIGTYNCNASCSYCINSSLAIRPEQVFTNKMSPGQIVKRAQDMGCVGIHFAINEDTIYLQSALAVAKAAKEAGLIVGASSNGYFTKYAVDLMLEYFDFFNISLKSLSDEFYLRELGLRNAAGIVKDNIAYLMDKTHVEVTIPVVSEMTEEEIKAIGAYLYSLDPNMAWHVFRVLPLHEMADAQPPDVGKLVQVIEGMEPRLNNIYFGNFVGSRWIDTLCPQCGTKLIERLCDSACGSRFLSSNLTDDMTCPSCAYDTKIKGQIGD